LYKTLGIIRKEAIIKDLKVAGMSEFEKVTSFLDHYHGVWTFEGGKLAKANDKTVHAPSGIHMQQA
jgi:hypothetical protein